MSPKRALTVSLTQANATFAGKHACGSLPEFLSRKVADSMIVEDLQGLEGHGFGEYVFRKHEWKYPWLCTSVGDPLHACSYLS